MTKRHQDGGFTVVEVLLVILILGISSLIVTVSVGGATAEAEDHPCDLDGRALTAAAQSYLARWEVDSITPTGTDPDRFERTLVDLGVLRRHSELHDLDGGGRLVTVDGSPCAA